MLEPTSRPIMQCLCCLMSCSGSQVLCSDGYTCHVPLLGHVLSADTRWQGKSELLCGLPVAAGNTAIITSQHSDQRWAVIGRAHTPTLVPLDPTPAILRQK